MGDKFIEQLKEILDMEEGEVHLNDHFRKLPGWDSLVYLSLIVLLDEEYEVAIEDKDFKKLITVQDILDEIKNRQN